jgi:hypothetical protein
MHIQNVFQPANLLGSVTPQQLRQRIEGAEVPHHDPYSPNYNHVEQGYWTS